MCLDIHTKARLGKEMSALGRAREGDGQVKLG